MERIVERRRGGYCFMLVGAFSALLRGLGYNVSLHTSAVGADPPAAVKWGCHVVAVVHLESEGAFVADVGLGDGPRAPFRLTPGAWEEEGGSGFRYALEERAGGQWRFTHDSLGSFPGFTVDLSTSVASIEEFGPYHEFYWQSPESDFVKAGVVLQRKAADCVYDMRSRTFRRLSPSSPGGKEVLAVPDSVAEWRALAAEYFMMPLEDLSEEDLSAVWECACRKHESREEKTSDAGAGAAAAQAPGGAPR